MKSISLKDFMNSNGDNVGILLSAACIAHCIALPLLAVLAPALGALAENELLHLSLLAVLFPVAIITFVNGKAVHRSSVPMYWGCTGLLFLATAILTEGASFSGFELETVLTVIGSLLLCFAHYQNLMLKRAYTC